MRRLLSILLACCFSGTAALHAQLPLQFFNTQEYGSRQGFTVDETIFHISTDNHGYLWISTGNGLFRFNGTLFKTFPFKKNIPRALPNREVRFFIQNSEGRYFTGISGSGLYEYHDTTGAFLPFTLVNDSFRLSNYVLGAPLVYGSRQLWVSIQGKGLLRINTATRQFRFYNLYDPERGTDFRSTAWVNNIIPARNGHLWLATNNGVVNLDTATGIKQYYHFVQPYPQLEHSAGSLYEEADGSLWIGTWAHGLVHLFPSTGKTEHYFVYPQKIANTENILHSVLPRNDNELWIGSYYGILIFNKQTKTFAQAANLDHEVNGAQVFGDPRRSKMITGFFLLNDRNRQLWASSGKLLTQLKLGANRFPYTFLPFGKVANKTGFSVAKVLPHPFKKNEWFCATQFGKGLYLFNTETGKAEPMQGVNGPPPACEVNDIRLHENRLWICTSAGVFLYDLVNAQFIPLPWPELSTATRGKYIFCITLNANSIWVGTGGLLHCDTRTGKTAYFTGSAQQPLPEADVQALFTDRKGNTWAGLTNGQNVVCIEAQTGRIVHFAASKNIFSGNGESITETPNGDIYFSNRLNGLYRVEKPLTASEKITQYTKADGLPGDRVYAVFADSRGYLWMNTSNGLGICDTRTMQFSHYDRQNGLPHEDLNGICTEAEPGSIVLPLKYGFTIIRPDSLLKPAPQLLPVSIQQFTVNGKEYDQNITYFNQQTFAYYENNFSIDFSALAYDDPAGIEYYYILKGLRKDTVRVGSRTNITLYALPPGKYTLQIRLKERNKPMQPEGFDFYFIIKPPFWKTGWFIALCSLLLAGLLYALYRYRVNQLVRLQKVRNTIAQDLHDDVGSTMTTIAILSDVAKQQMQKTEQPVILMDEIGQQSRGLLDKLDDIVWSVNPNNDSLQQMSLRMKQLAIDLLGNKGIKVEFSVPEQLDHISLSMEKRRNFYLVYKEALHNISKYAQARNVQVQVTKTGRQLQMTVTDDGAGFNRETQPAGNGLENMQRRAQQNGGICTILSEPGKGTTVSLYMPV